MRKLIFVIVPALLLVFLLLGGCIKLGPGAGVGQAPVQTANESSQQISGGEPKPAAAGGWNRNFGGPKDDEGVWVGETEDGNYLVVGSSNSYTEYYDVLLLKVDTEGREVWHKNIGDKYNENAFSAARTRDGGYVITGTTDSYDPEWGSSDAYLLKTDAEGNEVWHRNFVYDKGTQEMGNSVIETKDGGYLIVGTVNTYDGDKWTEIMAIKTDSGGNQEWSETYGGPLYDQGYSVVEAEDGYVIAAMLGTKDRAYDIYVMKISDNGALIWAKNYGTEQYDEAYSIAKAYDGGYVVAGRINNFEPFVMKIDAEGNEVWTKKYTGEGMGMFSHIEKTGDGNYTLVGSVRSVSDVYLLKINASGDVKLSATYGMVATDDDDYGKWVAETSDGGLIAAGTTESKGNPDIYVIRVPGENSENI